jgi:ABC-2 type transport system ATP-binding protein
MTSVAALAALGPALLLCAPTAPPHAAVAIPVAAALGVTVGFVLFAALARARPRVLITPLSVAVAGVGASEEATWRAFALGRLAPVAGVWIALAATTFGFAASHVPALRWRGASVHLLTGAIFGGLFAVTGSLVACGLAHAAYNLLAVAARRRPASALSCSGVEKRFGDVVALRGVDLTIERGELVALLGPNGAGKSTLVSLLVGLRQPSAGTVRLFGCDPRDWRTRAELGVTPQDMSFPPTLRVREILDLARAHADGAAATSALVDRFGLATLERRQAGGLSGGQRRRLALALAFASAPSFVALDEPTTGLDIESRRSAWEAVRAFAHEGGTVLFTTHSFEEARALARRIVVLARGTIVADGDIASEDELVRLTR